jgi:hypothetical protein
MTTQTDTNPYDDVIPYQGNKPANPQNDYVIPYQGNKPANTQSGQSNKPASPQNNVDQFMDNMRPDNLFPNGQNPAQAVKYPDEPSSLSDEQYEWFLNDGITPENISAAFKPYNPEIDGDFLTSRIMKFKPKEVDEKKVEKARTVASISDAVGMLAQMFAAGRGAHVKERDPNSLAMSRFNNEEKAMRELYRQKMDKHNNMILNAEAAAENRAYTQHQAILKTIRDSLGDKRGYDYKVEADKKEYERKVEQAKIENQRKDYQDSLNAARVEATISHNEEMEKQGRTRIAISAARGSGGGGGGGYRGGGSSEKTKTVYIDKDGVRSAVTYPVDKYNSVLGRARAEATGNPDFVKKHPGVVLGETGNGSYLFNDTYLVEAYVEDEWKAQHPTAKAPQPPQESAKEMLEKRGLYMKMPESTLTVEEW